MTEQNKKLLSWVRKTYPTQYQEKSKLIDALIKYFDPDIKIKEAKGEIEKLIIKS